MSVVQTKSDFFVISLELSESTKSILYELDKEIQINWSIEVEGLSNFKIKLRIDPPEVVSVDGLDPDKIKFQLLQPEAFKGLKSFKPSIILPG